MFLAEVNLHNHYVQLDDFHRIKINVVILHGAFKHEYRSRTAEMYIWAFLSHVIDRSTTAENHVIDHNMNAETHVLYRNSTS